MRSGAAAVFLAAISTCCSAAAIIIPDDYPTIGQGMDAASDGDTVLVREGSYSGPGNRDIGYGGKAVVLMSERGPEFTVIDCDGLGRGVDFSGGEGSGAVFDGFTVTNGAPDGSGGAIRIGSYASPVVSNCLLAGNSAVDKGGGIFCGRASTPSVSGCSISGNTASGDGGAVYCGPLSSASVENSVIDGNTASLGGGGISAWYGSIDISACVLTGNLAEIGAGIRTVGSETKIDKCRISSNTAWGSGGGIHEYSSASRLINCTITENEAAGAGGGIHLYNSMPVIAHCTFSDNYSTDGGGALYCRWHASPTIVNSILRGDEPSEIATYKSIPVVVYCNIEGGWIGEGNIDTDPYFRGNGDYHLMPVSPCIDAGFDAGVVTDIDGDARPAETGFDIGSDEVVFGGPLIHVTPWSFDIPAFLEEPVEDCAIKIVAVGDEPVDYTTNSGGCGWLWLEGDITGELQPGDTATVLLRFDITGMEQGRFADTVSVASNDPVYPLINVPVALKIAKRVILVPGDHSTIQEGIDAAVDGSVILVSDGTYTGSGNRDIDYRGLGVTVMSENGSGVTFIDCESQGRGFNFHSGEGYDSILDGFTIMNGYSSGCGGGIYCGDESSPGISGCEVFGCVAESGGGICINGGASPVIGDCRVNSCHASDSGAGIHCEFSPDARIENCVISCNTTGNQGGGVRLVGAAMEIDGSEISGNAAFKGGGIQCTRADASITNCVIWENNGSYRGGGVSVYECSPVISGCDIAGNDGGEWGGGILCSTNSDPAITDCVIIGNGADLGGGLLCWNRCSPVISGCIIVENVAGSFGGGVHVEKEGSPELVKCTLSGNAAITAGGALYGTGDLSRPRAVDCIMWNDEPEEIFLNSGNLYISYSDIQGGWGGEGNIDLYPAFVNTAEDDYSLLRISPCINAGDPELPNVPWGGSRRDMGADEYDFGWYLAENGVIVQKPVVFYFGEAGLEDRDRWHEVGIRSGGKNGGGL